MKQPFLRGTPEGFISKYGVIRAGTRQNNRADGPRQQVDHFLSSLTRLSISRCWIFLFQRLQGVFNAFGKQSLPD
jgi:hypothetical protein